ncbi:MAG: hypothetical protein AAGA53_16785 [Pseudomonadota bacterium]
MLKDLLDRHALFFFACVSAVVLYTTYPASSQDINFSSSPIISGESCVIELVQEGIFGVSANERTLNSQNFGGVGAQILVTSRKRGAGDSPGPRFAITLEPPTAFTTAPPGGDDNVTWRTRFSGVSVLNGVNFNNRNGLNPRRLPRRGTSVTQITGHLRARKPAGDAFPPGNYRAEAVFRCE